VPGCSLARKPAQQRRGSGLTVLFVELFVYAPIGVVERASLDNGIHYSADTRMFCGAILLLAGHAARSLAAGVIGRRNARLAPSAQPVDATLC
jgi:hypothetical protein